MVLLLRLLQWFPFLRSDPNTWVWCALCGLAPCLVSWLTLHRTPSLEPEQAPHHCLNTQSLHTSKSLLMPFLISGIVVPPSWTHPSGSSCGFPSLSWKRFAEHASRDCPHWSCSLLCPMDLAQRLMQSRCSISTYWMTSWSIPSMNVSLILSPGFLQHLSRSLNYCTYYLLL